MNRTLAFFLLLLVVAFPAAAQAPQSFTGNITAAGTTCLTAGACLQLPDVGDSAAAWIQVTGTFAGVTLNFEGTVRGDTWFALLGIVPGTGATASTTTAAGNWQFSTAGLKGIRVRASAYTSGTAVIDIRLSKYPPILASVTNLCTDAATGATITCNPMGVGGVLNTDDTVRATWAITAQGTGFNAPVPADYTRLQFYYSVATTSETTVATTGNYALASDSTKYWFVTFASCQNTTTAAAAPEAADNQYVSVLDTSGGDVLDSIPCPRGSGSRSPYGQVPLRATAASKYIILKPSAGDSMRVTIIGYKAAP